MPRKKKDPDMPKRPLSSYMFYSKERRPKLQEERPSLQFGEYSKIIAEEWKTMDAEKKQLYMDMSKKDKERYDEAVKEYKEKKKNEPPPQTMYGQDMEALHKNFTTQDNIDAHYMRQRQQMFQQHYGRPPTDPHYAQYFYQPQRQRMMPQGMPRGPPQLSGYFPDGNPYMPPYYQPQHAYPYRHPQQQQQQQQQQTQQQQQPTQQAQSQQPGQTNGKRPEFEQQRRLSLGGTNSYSQAQHMPQGNPYAFYPNPALHQQMMQQQHQSLFADQQNQAQEPRLPDPHSQQQQQQGQHQAQSEYAQQAQMERMGYSAPGREANNSKPEQMNHGGHGGTTLPGLDPQSLQASHAHLTNRQFVFGQPHRGQEGSAGHNQQQHASAIQEGVDNAVKGQGLEQPDVGNEGEMPELNGPSEGNVEAGM